MDDLFNKEAASTTLGWPFFPECMESMTVINQKLGGGQPNKGPPFSKYLSFMSSGWWTVVYCPTKSPFLDDVWPENHLWNILTDYHVLRHSTACFYRDFLLKFHMNGGMVIENNNLWWQVGGFSPAPFHSGIFFVRFLDIIVVFLISITN